MVDVSAQPPLFELDNFLPQHNNSLTVGHGDRPHSQSQQDTSDTIQNNLTPPLIPFAPNQNDSSSSAGGPDVELQTPSYDQIPPRTSHASLERQTDHGEGDSLLVNPPDALCIRRWTPFPTRSLIVRLFIVWNLCLIVVLVVLWSLSRQRYGLFDTNLRRANTLLLWHFVPTVVASTTAIAFNAIGTASILCQPYMNLLQNGGASAKDSLTLDFSGPWPVLAVRAMYRHHWVAFYLSAAVLLSTSFSSLTSALFSPQDVLIVQSTQFSYSKSLGHSGNTNATSAFIQALVFSTAHGTYGGAVSYPPLTNQTWAIAPIDFIDKRMLRGSDPSSTVNVTLPGWYGIQSDPGCDYGQVLNTTVSDFNLTVTFADRDGKCIFQPTPFPSYYPFAYINQAFACGNNNGSTLAQGGSLIFGRLTPTRLAQNDTTAAVVIYCRPRVTVMSVDATLDSKSLTLLSIDNVRPLSSEQQNSYDPTNFTTNFLASHAWNGFSIDPTINPNVPSLLIDWLNDWINLTISVYVGGEWLNKSTIQSKGIVMDDPQAYSDELQQYYMSTLTNFYQAYLTQLAQGPTSRMHQ